MSTDKNEFEDLKKNHFAEALESMHEGFARVGSLLSQIHQAQQKTRIRDTKPLLSNSDVTLNFSAQSIYVDNSNNTAALTLQSANGRLSFTIPANSQQWIHPLGGRQFHVASTLNGYAAAMFVDEFLPIK